MASTPTSSLKDRVADSVLRRMRAARAARSQDETLLADAIPASVAKSVRLREAQFSDFERVSAMNSRLGQGPDSPENWARIWINNPAVAEFKTGIRIGWVLETTTGIVGFLGSIPLIYEFEGKTLVTAATCRLAIEPAFRSYCHLLISSFFRQKNVELFLNSTATVAAGKMMTALNAAPIPQENHDTVLFWVLDPRSFAKAVLNKMGMSRIVSGVGSLLGSIVLKGDITMRARKPRIGALANCVVESCVRDMGIEFERLWLTNAGRPSQLRSRRTAAIMRWHFDPPQNRRSVQVFSIKGASDLGYLIVRHEEKGTNGIRRSLVADLMIKDDDPNVLEQLLAAAYISARRAGSHVLEVMGFPQNIRQSLLKLKPYTRKYPACPFFYKTRDRALHEKLSNPNVWYASPFDGDTTLWP